MQEGACLCCTKLLLGKVVSRLCLLVNNDNKRGIFSIKPIIDFISFLARMWGGCERAYTKSLNHSITHSLFYHVIHVCVNRYPSTIVAELLCDETNGVNDVVSPI